MVTMQTPFDRAVMEEKKFGEALKRLRVEAGLTQAELAEQAGMRQGNIANLENGRNRPTWRTVMTLALALNVNCDEFWTDEQPPPAKRPRRKTKED